MSALKWIVTAVVEGFANCAQPDYSHMFGEQKRQFGREPPKKSGKAPAPGGQIFTDWRM